ncbi:MAG TPA: alpha/beta hydrolase [Geminicoccaceae bacterium]|nr:alpha/beta hydrolase [Geminicoccaceae bacterium]
MSEGETERARLDAQYNLRAAVPEHLTYFARYEAESAALRARWPDRLDLAYGPSPRQAIDLFLPGSAGAPLLAFIHGGYWQSRDRKDFSFVAGPFLEQGAAVALIGYDLAPEVRMDAIVGQIRAGLAWLYRHAPEHGCDPERLHLAGHSAGGHLVGMALATDWRALGLPEDLIKGACPISGIFDLEPIRRCYLNDVVGLDADEARRNSPLHLPLYGRCPVIVAVGEAETQAFHEQSRAFADKLEREGRPCQLLVQPGVDHFAIIMSMVEPEAPLVRAIAHQMGLRAAPA